MAYPGNADTGRLEIHPLIHCERGRKIIRLDSRPADLAWHPSRNEVAVICRDGELVSFNLKDRSRIRWRKKINPVNAEMNPILKFTHNGDTLVILGPDGRIRVLESASGKLRYPPLTTEFNDFWTISISPDGNHLAAATTSGTVVIWNLETGRAVGDPLEHPKWVYRCRFSRDQKYLITASHDGKEWILTAGRDGLVRIWEPINGALMAPPVRVGHQAFNIEFNASGTSAVVGNLSRQTYILSLENLQQTIPFDEEYLCLLAEVASSSRIDGGSLHTLTTDEWIRRYNTLLQRYPESLLPSAYGGLQKKSLPKSVSFVDPLTMPSIHDADVLESAISLRTAGVDPCESCLVGKENCAILTAMN
jgi:WD40 repeat protein